MADHTANANAIYEIVSVVTTGTSTPLSPEYQRLIKQHLVSPIEYSHQINLEPLEVPINAAPWLGVVERRLDSSIGVKGAEVAQPGVFLSSDVVSAAKNFFAASSSLLPVEPYLYGLSTGELVAEFEAQPSRMTVIINANKALALTTIQGQTVHKEIVIEAAPAARIRADMESLVGRVGMEKHGSMDTER